LVPGNSRSANCGAALRRECAGFTLIELLLVVALIAIASGLASLALRDSAATRLDQEAVRLAAMLESARADSRAAGVAVSWQAVPDKDDAPGGFRFVGLPGAREDATPWLTPGVSAEVVGARALLLGPEPVIGAQRIVLHLDSREVALVTDGLSAFRVADESVER
jgi:general secretion pathway protein H